ncbi:hypothetical protein FOZ60_004642 [Perkinsus olseni]|uniref:Uncharacterized protein n=1 Tax=Perkinsus olseni TaxID=32597 RepID=A0A7J6NSU1_PEROL|nr:hypothetical protein FOZ60_004642 [Perkinsus olseni]
MMVVEVEVVVRLVWYSNKIGNKLVWFLVMGVSFGVLGVLVYGPAIHVLDVPIKKVFKSDRLFYFLLPETPEQEDAVTGMLSTASTLAQMDLLDNATTKADATIHLSKATRALKDSTTEVVESLADKNELKIEVKKASDVPIQGITATVASLSKLAIREDLLDYLHGPHGLIPPSLYQSMQKIQQEITLEGNNTVIKLRDETTRVVQLAQPLFMTSSSSSSSSLPMIALENASGDHTPPRHDDDDDDDVTSKTVLGCLFMNVRELRLAGVKIMSNVKEDARELKNTITEMKNSGKRLVGAVKGDTSVLRVLFKGLATIPMALSKSHKLIERMSFHCQQLYGRVNHALSTGAESIAITGLKERFKQIAASILVLRQEISTLVKRDISSPLLKLTLEDFQRQQAASVADLSKWIMNPPSKTDTLEPLVEEARRGSTIASGRWMIDSYTEVINRGQGPEGRAAVEEESIYDERQLDMGEMTREVPSNKSYITGTSPITDATEERGHTEVKEEERQSLEDDNGGGDTNSPLLIAHKHQQHDIEDGRGGGGGIDKRTTSM